MIGCCPWVLGIRGCAEHFPWTVSVTMAVGSVGTVPIPSYGWRNWSRLSLGLGLFHTHPEHHHGQWRPMKLQSHEEDIQPWSGFVWCWPKQLEGEAPRCQFHQDWNRQELYLLEFGQPKWGGRRTDVGGKPSNYSFDGCPGWRTLKTKAIASYMCQATDFVC